MKGVTRGSITMYSRGGAYAVPKGPPGPIEFPEDFPERLRRLKDVSGLSWNGFAQAIGADPRQVARWRNGVEPAGAAMLALFELAKRIPGGVEVMLGLDAPLIGVRPPPRFR